MFFTNETFSIGGASRALQRRLGGDPHSVCLFVLPIAPLLQGCTSHPHPNCPSFSPSPSHTRPVVWPLCTSQYTPETHVISSCHSCYVRAPSASPITTRKSLHMEWDPAPGPLLCGPSAVLPDGVSVLFPLLPLCQHLSGELWCCFMCLPLQLDRRLLRDTASSSAWAHHLVQPRLAKRANE